MITARAVSTHQPLSPEEILAVLQTGLSDLARCARLLVLIPDHTRTAPLPFLFRALLDVLGSVETLDFMVALGTHPGLDDASLNRLVGISECERADLAAGRALDGRGQSPKVHLLNHEWENPAALVEIGRMEADEIRAIAGASWHSSLPEIVPVRINRAALEYDQILVLGPTFPHEVVGFSGGAKYLFPGISGAEMINATHWLGALAGVVGTIGIQDTPVRRMIHAAAGRLQTPVRLAALTVEEHALTGIHVGDLHPAWEESARLSTQRHISYTSRPYRQVLSCAPEMYDELWTAAKAMYKLEPAVALGGEVIIHAPHLDTVSRVHGKYIREIGYHILPYFLADWPRFRHIPLGVLAHSTHLRGSGRMLDGVEVPNVKVTLASRISAEDCARLNLGYLDPASIHPEEWAGREDEGILLVPRAGEVLYRVKGEQA